MNLLTVLESMDRVVISWCLNTPRTNAVIYNVCDMAANCLVFYDVSVFARKHQWSYNIIKSAVIGRLSGLAVGFFVAGALGYPVRGFDALVLSAASSFIVICHAYGKSSA